MTCSTPRHGRTPTRRRSTPRVAVEGKDFTIGDGDVVIAAITSCTNTSNPGVLIAAGLLAQEGGELGLKPQAVGEDLARARLAGRHRLPRQGRACRATSTSSASTWSATAAPPASATPARCRADQQGDQRQRPRRRRGAVGQPQLRRPRNPDVRANYLASPPLVVAYALAGTVIDIDLTTEPIGTGKDGKPVYLKDIWPTNEEVADTCARLHGPRDVPGALRRRVQGRQALAGDQDVTGGKPTVATGSPPTSPEPALLRGHER
jgi:aconitate hydratase